MHSIIDAYFRQLRVEGVGIVVKHASLISKEEENALWDSGVLGDDTPEYGAPFVSKLVFVLYL